MSRSSGLYFRHKKNQRLNESEDFLDFLDFNEFGPDADAEHDVTNKQMTLDEFVNLPIFNTENSQKAIIALKNNETIELQNNDDSVKLSSSDNETVTIEYGDIVLDFSKNDLLQALQENIELEVSESVLKFKEFINEDRKSVV